MSKLPPLTSVEIVNALLRGGFEIARKSKESHQTLKRARKLGGTDVTVVPIGKKEIPRGTLQSILKLANVEVEEFLDWL